MVENVEHVSSKFQIELLANNCKVLRKSRVKKECAGPANQIPAPILQPDRASKLRKHLVGADCSACEAVDGIRCPIGIDFDLEICLLAGKYCRVLAVERCKIRIGVWCNCQTSAIAWETGYTPPPNHFVKPPRSGGQSRLSAPNRQIVDNIRRKLLP